MAYVPKIKTDQERPGPSVSAGEPGVARKDLWLANRVLLSVVDAPPGATYSWAFVDKPEGSAAAFVDPGTGLPANTIAAPAFTPDLWGSYNIELYVNGTRYHDLQTVSALYSNVGVQLNLGLRPFALGETVESLRWDLGGGAYNDRYNVPDIYELISAIVAAGGGAPVGATYLTLTPEVALIGSRQAQFSARFATVDGGAGSTFDIDLDSPVGLAPGTYDNATVTVDVYGRVTAASAGGTGTSSTSFTINNAAVADTTSSFMFERGPAANTGIRWNHATATVELTRDGAAWDEVVVAGDMTGTVETSFTVNSAAVADTTSSFMFERGPADNTGIRWNHATTTIELTRDGLAWDEAAVAGDLPAYLATMLTVPATVGDGIADDTAAIVAAVAAAAANGTEVFFPPGTYRITASVTVPTGVRISGKNAVITLDDGANHEAFIVEGDEVRISGMGVTIAAGVAPIGANTRGVMVRSGASDVVIENCSISRVNRGVDIPFLVTACERVTVRDCVLTSLDGYGVYIEDCDAVLLENVVVDTSGYACFKLSKKTRNVTVRNCIGRRGGQTATSDGIDCYAGGDLFLVDGCIFEDNTGNGILVKSDDLTRDDPANYGYVRSFQIVNCRCNDNTGYGISTHRHEGVSGADDPTIPLLSGASIVGCVANNNTGGFLLGARGVSLVNPVARGNDQEGICLMNCCLDISITNPVMLGNGSGASAVYDLGIRIDGNRISVVGGVVCGVEDDTTTRDSDLGTATPTAGAATYNGIHLNPGADNVSVIGARISHCRNADLNRAGGRLLVQDVDKVTLSGLAQPEVGAWTLGAGWVNNLDDTYTAAGVGELTQTGILVVGRSYIVTFTIDSITAGAITPYAGTTAGTPRAAPGTYTETLVCAADTDLDLAADAGCDATISGFYVSNSETTGPTASAGTIRLPNGINGIAWRNAADTADIEIGCSGDVLNVGGANNSALNLKAGADGIQVGTDATTKFGFGKAPVTIPVLPTGAGKTVDEVITALQSLGWATQA